jgi:type 1 glutamine amidotransferase
MSRFGLSAVVVLAGFLWTSTSTVLSQNKKNETQLDKVLKALPEEAPAKAKQPRKILIYSKTAGFRHGSITIGAKAITLMGEKTKAYITLHTEDDSFFAPEKLKAFDAVFMLNTTGNCLFSFLDEEGRTIPGAKETVVDQKISVVDEKGKAIEGAKVQKLKGKDVAVDANGNVIPKAKITKSGGRNVIVDSKGKELPNPQRVRDASKLREEALKKSLADFVASGKGLIGVHSATDTYHGWKDYNKMMGGTFAGHPWHKNVPVKNLDPKHPVNAAFGGADFDVVDEIYQFRADTALPTERRFLLSLDTKKMDVSAGNRKDGLYPVSWISTFGKGRTFYCSLGHNEHIFWNPTILKHYLAGIQYALGDLEVDATPISVSGKQ